MSEYIKNPLSGKLRGVTYEDGKIIDVHIRDTDDVVKVFVPVRHGRWEKNVRGDYSIVCSECGYGFPTDGYAWLECNRRSDEREYCFQITDVKNYCPNCGARMVEEVEHER